MLAPINGRRAPSLAGAAINHRGRERRGKVASVRRTRAHGSVGLRRGAGERELAERAGVLAGACTGDATEGLRGGIRSRSARLRAGHESARGPAAGQATVVERRGPPALKAQRVRRKVGPCRRIRDDGTIDGTIDRSRSVGRCVRRAATGQRPQQQERAPGVATNLPVSPTVAHATWRRVCHPRERPVNSGDLRDRAERAVASLIAGTRNGRPRLVPRRPFDGDGVRRRTRRSPHPGRPMPLHLS
jgi:hypothetical protein